MPKLIAPTVELHASFLEAREEWGEGAWLHGHGVRPTDDVVSAAGFERWVASLHDQEDESIPPTDGWVHCTYRWIVEDDRFLGAIALRHTLNDWLLQTGGHVGYGLRPTARGRGLAGWALGETLETARSFGLDRLLLTCHPDNTASARTIESHGGVLEDIRNTGPDRVKRYWIALR